MSTPKTQALLLDAIDQGNISGLLMSFAMGADPNALDEQKRTPLHRAMDMARGQVLHQIVDAILENGADPLRKDARPGPSLLLKAVLQQDERLISRFLQEGASVSQADHNDVTPLMAAAGLGSPRLCELLLNASNRKAAVIEMRDSMGRTALMHGASHPEVALYLLSNGADPRCKDGNGKTAMDFSTDSAVTALMRAKATSMDAQDEQRQRLASENANDLAAVMALASRMSSQLLGPKTEPSATKPKPRR